MSKLEEGGVKRREQSKMGLEGSHVKLQSQLLAAKLRYSEQSPVRQCWWCVGEQTGGLLHDGSVNHRLNVVPPVTRVDHSLSL